jgi:beta-lactamase regulating signal transducer with metallopeptidase domain
VHELAFPLAGAFVLFALAIPLSTVWCRVALALLRRVRPGACASGSSIRYLLIVAPVAAPMAWFASAAAHHSEPGQAAALCAVGHHVSWCTEPLILLGLIAGAASLAVLGWRSGRRSESHRAPSRALRRRLQIISRAYPELSRLRGPVGAQRVRSTPGEGMWTEGLLAPKTIVGEALAGRLTDDELAAALLHEGEHIRGLDPLRYGVLGLCQRLNPLARWFSTELSRFRLAREAACDHAAVKRGADPLCLARAIIAGARPAPPAGSPALDGDGVASVRLRISLLLGYAAGHHCPCARRRRPEVGLVIALLALLPHALDAWPLHDLHRQVESALLSDAVATPDTEG